MDYFIAVRSALGTAVSKRTRASAAVEFWYKTRGRLSAFLWRREQAKIAGVDVDVTFTISHHKSKEPAILWDREKNVAS